MKDYDVATNIATKSPSTSKFIGEDDNRSGSTFVREIVSSLEGHDAVTKYLWAKQNIEGSIWAKLIKGTEPPTRCYLDYEKHLDRLCSTIRKLYDNDDAIAKAEVQFVTCQQGDSESLSNFVKRLESIVTELHFMGIRTYEYILKRRLYDGLNSDYLREKIDNELSDKAVSYDKFVTLLSNYERRRLGREQRQKLYSEIVTSRLAPSKSKSKTSESSQAPMTRVNALEPPSTDLGYGGSTNSHLFAVGADSMSIKCYRCLETGHPARLCRGKVSNQESRCSKCGNPNHTAGLCEVPTKSLNCQRCLRQGHLAYVCRASSPVDADSSAKTTKGKPGRGTRPKSKAGPPRRPTKSTKRPSPSTPSTNAQVVDESSKAHVIGSSTALNSMIKVSPLGIDDINSSSNVLHTGDELPSSRPSPASSRISMVVGDLSICGVVRPVLYDTGADVSLIAAGTLRKITNKKLYFDDPSVQGRVNVANGSSLSILGKVELEVGYGKTLAKDSFLLASDDLSTPVIIGCSTMAKLRTTISISPEGILVRLGDRPAQVTSIEAPEPRLSLRDMDWLRKVAVMHVSHVVSLSTVSTISPTPSMTFKSSSLDLHYGGTNETHVLFDTFNDDIEIHPDLPVSVDFGTTACVQAVDSPSTSECDLLPPWQAIAREWIKDDLAPLGRVSTQVPWRDSKRPGFNFYYAAKRGLASIARLDSKQQSMFEDALSQLINKGFCSIVCDLRSTGIKKPARPLCQKAWSTLVRGTAYEGTSVPLAEHFTPSHLVYRPSHPTTPCRIVFDFRDLNRFSNRGGYPQNSLAGCLLAIRSYKHFIAGDLSKAFCRMSSSIDDVPYVGYTCIGPYVVLWSRVAFGSTAAPNQLDASMEDVTIEMKSLSDLAAAVTAPIVRLCDLDPRLVETCLLRPSPEAHLYLRDCPAVPKELTLVKFVDDLYTGGDSKCDVTTSYDFLAYISNGHDFVIESRKRFNSWEPVIVDDIEERRHLLGYDYSAVEDSFYPTFSGALPKVDSMTKRQSCAVLASFYDPLGLIVEHDMQARSIWRDINKSTPEWESTIPLPLKVKVCDWVSLSLRLTKSMPTPRYVRLDAPLVLSTDASKDAWGADLRSASDLSTRLAGKGGLFSAPQLPWSIPRKELDGLHRGLLWVKGLSPYLPVSTHYAQYQAPLSALFPRFQDQALTVVVDSEVTVYRLRRPSNDSKLPAPEQRRLSAVRELCHELKAVIKHVPSNCNASDSISRCVLPKAHNADSLSDAMSSSTVVYDPNDDHLRPDSTESTPPCEDAGCGLRAHTIASLFDDAGYAISIDDLPLYDPEEPNRSSTACHHVRGPTVSNVNTVNCDGLNLPNIDGSTLSDDEKDELKALLEFVDTSRGSSEAPSATLDDIEFKDRLTACVRRCQSCDDDLSKFRGYLEGHVASGSIGLRRTVFERMSKHCHLDTEGIIRQRRWYSTSADSDEDGGTMYLGNSTYAYLLLCVLAAIYHYSYGHPGQRRLRLIINRRFTARGISTAIQKTTSSCTLCLRARASKSIRYLNSDVQDMVTTQLWQLVGVDIVGPYGRPSLRRRAIMSSKVSSSSIASNGGNSFDPSKDYYILVCQDAVSGFIAARSMRDSKGPTLAAALHSIFCEHGAPAVVVSDRGIHTLMSRAVRSILAKHGCRQYTLPGYSQHLTFWERSHRDLSQTSKAIAASSASSEDYIFSYLLAIRCYNCTARYWSTLSPSSLHYSYRQRLPGDLPSGFPAIDWDKLEIKYLNVDYLPYVRSLLPTLADQQEKVKITVQEYVDAWRQKQAHLRERAIKESPQDYKLELYDLVYISETSDHAPGGHLSSTWRGPLTVVRLAGTAMVYLFDGILLPNDYGGNLRISEDGNSIENGPEHSTLVYASLKNLVPARALQSLIYDHYEQGTRVYQDANGDLVTMPASSDGTDQSKITLRRAKQLAAGKRSSSSSSPDRDDGVLLPASHDLPLSPRSSVPTVQADPSGSTMAEVSTSVQLPEDPGEQVPQIQVPTQAVPSSSSNLPISRSTRRGNTALVFGNPIPTDITPRPGWLVVSTDASSYQGLASIEDSSNPGLLSLRPVRLHPGSSGMLSVADSGNLQRVASSRLIYITSSTRPLTRSLFERTCNLLERLGI